MAIPIIIPSRKARSPKSGAIRFNKIEIDINKIPIGDIQRAIINSLFLKFFSKTKFAT
ncbi:MAG: hypothetical protein JXA99_13020 [Candidatus Lokiarchaeota archaeon]|nr:hypothetical protein [Candidatus Lokiarchaeota archaeon]